MTTETQDAPSEPTATVLGGKYELGPVLGTGGMGTVYGATHLVLGCPVAVKLMHHSSDPHVAERFLREARLAAAARHPNVVSILDFGTTPDGQPYMVMEMLEGRTLADHIDQGHPLSLDQRVSVMAQVLSGLDAVHRAGIVHRDLKPANVFVTPLEDGRLFARLLDFGISFSVSPEKGLQRGRFGTDERTIIGTPEYMSPEQAEGRPDIDVRADVYAVGVMLYELLSGGQLPYADPNPGGILFKIMAGKHTPLSMLRPDLPTHCDVVAAAMAHDRDARPASAKALRRLLMAAHGREDRSDPEIELSDRDLLALDAPLPRRSDFPTAEAAGSVAPSLTGVPLRSAWRRSAALGLAVVAGIALAIGSTHLEGPSVPAVAAVRTAPTAPVGTISDATPRLDAPTAASVPSAPPLELVVEAPALREPAREERRPAASAVREPRSRDRASRRAPRAGTVLRELDF